MTEFPTQWKQICIQRLTIVTTFIITINVTIIHIMLIITVTIMIYNQTRSGIKSAFRGSLPSLPHHHLPSETTHTLTITTSNTSKKIIMSCPRLTLSNRAKPQWPKHWSRFIFLKIVISDLRSSIDQLLSFDHYHYHYHDLFR